MIMRLRTESLICTLINDSITSIMILWVYRDDTEIENGLYLNVFIASILLLRVCDIEIENAFVPYVLIILGYTYVH